MHARWLRCRHSTGLQPAFAPPPRHRTRLTTLATSGFFSTLLVVTVVQYRGPGVGPEGGPTHRSLRSLLDPRGAECLDRQMGTYVFDFAEGDKDQKDLLGGKGANLAEMTNLGLPVPPGFTISTDACRAYMATGELPSGLDAEVDDHLRRLEKKMKRILGDSADPLLVSVRSGS